MKNHPETMSVFFSVLLPALFSSELGKIFLQKGVIFYEAIETCKNYITC